MRTLLFLELISSAIFFTYRNGFGIDQRLTSVIILTEMVSLKSEEGQEPRAKEAAVAKEVAFHAELGTWDLSRVRELSEWMLDDAYSEVLVGRVFVILGVKFVAMAMALAQFSAERLRIGMQRPSNHSSS